MESFLDGIECVVVGGESDSNARPLYYDWVLHIREQCIRADVSFEFRQCGTHFIKDGKTVDEISLEAFVGMAYVAEHQGTASGNGNSQFHAQKRKIHISFYAETAFQCVGFIVVTCINNGSICSGNTHADVVFFLNQKNFELVPGEGPGCHTAQHTASDDTDVCMKGTTHIEWFPDAPECIPQAFPDVPGKRRFSG